MGELRDVLVTAAIVILPVLAAIATQYARIYLARLKEKVEQEIGEANLDAILTFAELFIRAAEQQFDLEEDEAKKAFVVGKLLALRDRYGLPLTDVEIADLVEGVYNRIKGEL